MAFGPISSCFSVERDFKSNALACTLPQNNLELIHVSLSVLNKRLFKIQKNNMSYEFDDRYDRYEIIQPIYNLKDEVTRKLHSIIVSLNTSDILDISRIQDKIMRLTTKFQDLEKQFIGSYVKLSNFQQRILEKSISMLQKEIEHVSNLVQVSIRNQITLNQVTFVSGNKPFLLSSEHTMDEFRIWKHAFTTYYNSSHMEQIPVADQQIRLLQCLQSKVVFWQMSF